MTARHHTSSVDKGEMFYIRNTSVCVRACRVWCVCGVKIYHSGVFFFFFATGVIED